MKLLTFTLCFILGYFTNSLVQPIIKPNLTTIGIIGYKQIADLSDRNMVNLTTEGQSLVLKDFNASSSSKFTVIRSQSKGEIITSWIDQNGKKHTEITEIELIKSTPDFVDYNGKIQHIWTW